MHINRDKRTENDSASFMDSKENKWQRTGINGESMSMVWPTLGLRTATEPNSSLTNVQHNKLSAYHVVLITPWETDCLCQRGQLPKISFTHQSIWNKRVITCNSCILQLSSCCTVYISKWISQSNNVRLLRRFLLSDCCVFFSLSLTLQMH